MDPTVNDEPMDGDMERRSEARGGAKLRLPVSSSEKDLGAAFSIPTLCEARCPEMSESDRDTTKSGRGGLGRGCSCYC